MKKIRNGILHFIAHPVAAERFVAPLVDALNAKGMKAELCIEFVPGYQKFLESIKSPYFFANSNLSGGLARVLKSLFVLLYLLHTEKPYAVQAHLTRGAFLPLFSAWLTRIPVRIYHNHGVPYLGYSGPLFFGLKILEALNCFFATHIITVSSGMVPALMAVCVSQKPILLFGPGSACGLSLDQYLFPDLELKYQHRSRFGIDKHDLVFLYVGRPEIRKGFDLIAKAFLSAFESRPDVYLLVAGPSEADVEKYSHHSRRNIKAIGHIYDLRSIYLLSDVVALPSLHEGFGYSLLEGAALGCAMLASRIPGPSVIVKDGVNGLLVAPGDQDELIDGMRTLDRDRESLLIMQKNAYERSQDFQRDKIVAPYLIFAEKIFIC